MEKTLYIIFIIGIFFSCEKDPYTINYQEGYPNRLTGVWLAYEYHNADKNNTPYPEYELITALDPNSDSLIISNLYASGFRVKAKIDSNTFKVDDGKQLEVINQRYGVESITLHGELNENEVHDALVIHAKYMDNYGAPVDSVMIVALRKTGFEDSEQYNF